jgi:hypothetical protein
MACRAKQIEGGQVEALALVRRTTGVAENAGSRVAQAVRSLSRIHPHQVTYSADQWKTMFESMALPQPPGPLRRIALYGVSA